MTEETNESLSRRVAQLERLTLQLIKIIASHTAEVDKASLVWSIQGNLDDETAFAKAWPEHAAIINPPPKL